MRGFCDGPASDIHRKRGLFSLSNCNSELIVDTNRQTSGKMYDKRRGSFVKGNE